MHPYTRDWLLIIPVLSDVNRVDDFSLAHTLILPLALLKIDKSAQANQGKKISLSFFSGAVEDRLRVALRVIVVNVITLASSHTGPDEICMKICMNCCLRRNDRETKQLQPQPNENIMSACQTHVNTHNSFLLFGFAIHNLMNVSKVLSTHPSPLHLDRIFRRWMGMDG